MLSLLKEGSSASSDSIVEAKVKNRPRSIENRSSECSDPSVSRKPAMGKTKKKVVTKTSTSRESKHGYSKNKSSDKSSSVQTLLPKTILRL